MKNDIDIVGKQVKDMYGASIGKVVGTIVDIDGAVQMVGVYSSGTLRQIPFEQLVIQKESDIVIYIPRWRLDSQRLLREKNMLLRRLRALADIVSENGDMKQDAETAYSKYKARMLLLDESQKSVKNRLDERLAELDTQIKAIKSLVFDARVQLKSDEISEETFDAVKTEANSIMEYIANETAEIVDVQKRIEDLSTEVSEAIKPAKTTLQPYPDAYPESDEEIESRLPKAPTDPVQVESTEESAPHADGIYASPQSEAREEKADEGYPTGEESPEKMYADAPTKPNDESGVDGLYGDRLYADSSDGSNSANASSDSTISGLPKAPSAKPDWLSRMATQ